MGYPFRVPSFVYWKMVVYQNVLPEFNAMYFLPVNNVDFDFSHTRNNIDDFPDATLDDAGNYCRSPDGEPNLWCYTTNSSSRREFCNVPLCEGETLDKNIIN